VAENFRPNPKLDAAAAVQELAVGEALCSFLDAKGIPSIVERALIAPPRGRMGPLNPQERAAVIQISPFAGAYEQAIDRESAYEVLIARVNKQREAAGAPQLPTGPQPQRRSWGGARQTQSPAGDGGPGSMLPKNYPMPTEARPAPAPRGPQRQTMTEAIAKSAARSVTTAVAGGIGRALVRGVLGALIKRR
jgi:DNA helicase HerA-like ATPase